MKFTKLDHDLRKYGQYKNDIFEKLAFPFEPGFQLLDVGCGDCSDAKIFKEAFCLLVKGCDVYKHPNSDLLELDFTNASADNLPYSDKSFDYTFIHDVLHHVDELNQDRAIHIKALGELKRVTKAGGYVIILEGNRYNPLFYPHMVKIRGHNHFTQYYFKQIVLEIYPKAEFKFFEAHLYPTKLLKFFKLYEYLMERFAPRSILAYNVAICRVQ